MHRPALRGALVGAMVLAALLPSACASLRFRLPEPEAGLERERVEPKSSSCWLGRCTATLQVGEQGLQTRVETRAKTMSPEEATDRPRGSLLRRVGGEIRGTIARGLGGETSRLTVGRGSRVVREPSGRLALHCDIVWVTEERTRREDGKDVTETERLAQGVDCAATAPTDSTDRRWRFRAGISPRPDSLALVFETSVFPDRDFGGAVLALDRHAPAGDSSGAPALLPYSVTVDRITIDGPVDLPGTRWTFRRRDGTVIGAILRPAIPPSTMGPAPGMSTVVDLAPRIDPEEAAVLRLIASLLAEPFTSTQ